MFGSYFRTLAVILVSEFSAKWSVIHGGYKSVIICCPVTSDIQDTRKVKRKAYLIWQCRTCEFLAVKLWPSSASFLPAGGPVWQEAGESREADWWPGRGEEPLDPGCWQPAEHLRQPDGGCPHLGRRDRLPGPVHSGLPRQRHAGLGQALPGKPVSMLIAAQCYSGRLVSMQIKHRATQVGWSACR